jgi:hypothetical protein
MDFRIRGLEPALFRHLFGLDDAALAAAGACRYLVDHSPGFPDRVEVRDLEPGESALLVNYTHQPADNPYRASHAVFVREGATAAYDAVNEIPRVIRTRTISLRAFDQDHMLADADLVEGRDMESAIARMFRDGSVAYLHAHYAKPGCYAARIDRV